jgi:hypothetical protein
MLKRMTLVSLAATLCLGASCTVRISPDGNGNGDGGGLDGQPYLDQADASIIIGQRIGEATADVTATITDSLGRPVTLTSDRAVKVNDVSLSGPDADDEFTASVDAADQYKIKVVEPTRGIEETVIDTPTDFEITSPADHGAVSLSGFKLKWSRANSRLQVRIKLSQTFDGTQTRNFGPYTDTGSREFTQEDLNPPFGHGGDLTLSITVTKINTTNNVNGFNSGTASVRLSTTRVARPGP